MVVDTADTGDPRAVDWAARTAAGAILRLAGTGGCRVLLPGDQVATTVTDLTAAWHGVHRRLALLQPGCPATGRDRWKLERYPSSTSGLPMRPPRCLVRRHGRCRRAWSPRRLSGGRPMTRPAGASAPRPGRAAMATATAVLVGTGAVSWWWVLRGSLVGIALVVAVAAVTVLLAAELLAYRPAAVLLAVWLAAGVWAAGVPAGQLLPHAWPSLLARLAGGMGRLTALGSVSGPIGNDPWPLAAWLLGAGAVWVAGAALATSGPSTRRRAIAFGLLAAPWIAAVAARHSDRAAWQGAAVLVAGLLWLGDRRGALRRVLALGLVAAVVSVAITQAIGPRTPGSPARPSGATVRFLPGERAHLRAAAGPARGATLLEVTAAQPALWRMRVLNLFTGPGWRVDSPRPELPQPAAQPVEVKVVVRGLGNDLMVAPGRINAVHAHGTASPVAGEAWQLTPPPRRGDTYQVQASVVRASAEQLQRAPAPTDPRLRAYTSLFPGYGWPSTVVVPLFGQPPDPEVTATLDLTPYGPVAALARQLAAGATSQWEVVARVHHYLLDGGRFRYTTNLPPGRPVPAGGLPAARPRPATASTSPAPRRCCCGWPASRPGWWSASPPACPNPAGGSTCAMSTRTPGSRCTSKASAGWRSTPPQRPPKPTSPASSTPSPQPPPAAPTTPTAAPRGWTG